MQGIHDKVCAAIAAVLISLLTACGGGSGDGTSNGSAAPSPPASGVHLQIVSFGDSLSDVETFAPIASAVGGAFHDQSGASVDSGCRAILR